MSSTVGEVVEEDLRTQQALRDLEQALRHDAEQQSEASAGLVHAAAFKAISQLEHERDELEDLARVLTDILSRYSGILQGTVQRRKGPTASSYRPTRSFRGPPTIPTSPPSVPSMPPSLPYRPGETPARLGIGPTALIDHELHRPGFGRYQAPSPPTSERYEEWRRKHAPP